MSDEELWIESAVHAVTGEPGCILRWGTIETALPPDVVQATARDLFAAATHAETDIALIRLMRDQVRMDLPAIGAMLRDVRLARPMPNAKVALRIQAVAGAGTDLPYVHIARGTQKGSFTPAEAREMAGHWIAASVAAQLDARLRRVLADLDQITNDDINAIFTSLRNGAGD